MTALALPADVARAVDELERAFSVRVSVTCEDGTGAIVCLADIELGERWTPRRGALWFLIPFHYPDAAIYPYYVVGATPTGGVIGGLQQVGWRGMDAIQVSLRHTAWNPAVDNAVGSVLQTQAWLRNR